MISRFVCIVPNREDIFYSVTKLCRIYAPFGVLQMSIQKKLLRGEEEHGKKQGNGEY